MAMTGHGLSIKNQESTSSSEMYKNNLLKTAHYFANHNIIAKRLEIIL